MIKPMLGVLAAAGVAGALALSTAGASGVGAAKPSTYEPHLDPGDFSQCVRTYQEMGGERRPSLRDL